MLGEQMEKEVQSFIKATQDSGGVVNAQIVMATARGVIMSHDVNLLAENGGYINITKDWAKRLLQRMNIVKRNGTIKAKVMPADFDKLKA